MTDTRDSLQRERFEKWFATEHPQFKDSFMRHKDGDYWSLVLRHNWKTWQARAALSKQGWLPIESAPKDGSWIAAKRMGKRPFAVRYIADSWQDENNLYRDPTHFCALPPSEQTHE